MTDLLPLGDLGAIEKNGTVTFGLWLPWVSDSDGNRVSVKVIHERDQFLQAIPPREFPMTHSVRSPHGDFWSVTVSIAGTPPAVPGSSWGTPGRYLFRYQIDNPNVGRVDWLIDPFAREFGKGKLSAFTLGYQPYTWSASEAGWRTPALADLVLYEVNVAELGGDFARASELMAYLADLGVNGIEVMPLSNVPNTVDWGYLPIGYFGVDERLGNRADFQQLVDVAHSHGIAVIVDMVYGHTGIDFPYYDAYSRLQYHENPFMGPFAKDYFSSLGKSTDFTRQLTREYFFTVNQHWLDVYHVDGFRYDCVPNFWDGPMGVGYASLVYDTYQVAKAKVAQGASFWTRFDAGAGLPIRLIQCAEQLESPQEILRSTYSNSTWQNSTFDAARAVARGQRDRLTDWGLSLGLAGYTEQEKSNGEVVPKTALQYIENHDHERFVNHFGQLGVNEDLFREGDRSQWYKLQPYLISLLCAPGIPMLWQGQEFAENYWVPDGGMARVMLFRPVRWDYFYDDIGRATSTLVRKLTALRHARRELRRGNYYFYNDEWRYQFRGLLVFSREDQGRFTLIAVNFSGTEQTVPFWFPIAGTYREQLHDRAEDVLANVPTMGERQITIPGNYGRIWSNG